ncbi:PrkA family serine protein kinase [Serratia liquefaciens]|nr:PrkA family serine protein kinase [Serratia liquefaciens]
MNIFDHYRQRYEAAKDEEFTLQEFLTICRQDRSAYANAAERLLMAIGEPVMVDTALESRMSRLFSNRVIARYPAFEEFYGMEEAIEQIGVRLENGKYPTLSLFFVQITSWVYGDS